MHNIRQRLVTIAAAAALLCTPGHAAGRNFIWKASSATGTVYLAGSVHLLSASYYPLDPAFGQAFEVSDLLVEELNMSEMLAPDAQMRMLTQGMLPAGRSLASVISAQTLEQVKKTAAELGLPIEPLLQFKPWMLALTLQGLAWQKAGFDADLGVDKHFYDMATATRKPVEGLETLDYQIQRFDGMPADAQDRLLAETLAELETTKQNVTQMADAWKQGDAATLERLLLQDLKSEPEMYERLLLERNRAWLPKIEALFRRPRPAFVMVGAAHLIGSDGLLQLLRAKGYRIEQL